MVQVLGYYAEKKKANSTTTPDQNSGQPPQSDGVDESEKVNKGEGHYAKSVTAPSMRNKYIGVKVIVKNQYKLIMSSEESHDCRRFIGA